MLNQFMRLKWNSHFFQKYLRIETKTFFLIDKKWSTIHIMFNMVLSCMKVLLIEDGSFFRNSTSFLSGQNCMFMTRSSPWKWHLKGCLKNVRVIATSLHHFQYLLFKSPMLPIYRFFTDAHGYILWTFWLNRLLGKITLCFCMKSYTYQRGALPYTI